MKVFVEVRTQCIRGGAGAMGDKKSLTANRIGQRAQRETGYEPSRKVTDGLYVDVKAKVSD